MKWSFDLDKNIPLGIHSFFDSYVGLDKLVFKYLSNYDTDQTNFLNPTITEEKNALRYVFEDIDFWLMFIRDCFNKNEFNSINKVPNFIKNNFRFVFIYYFLCLKNRLKRYINREEFKSFPMDDSLINYTYTFFPDFCSDFFDCLDIYVHTSLDGMSGNTYKKMACSYEEIFLLKKEIAIKSNLIFSDGSDILYTYLNNNLISMDVEFCYKILLFMSSKLNLGFFSMQPR